MEKRAVRFRLGETLVFLGPLLIFLIVLYGMLLWTIYVSFSDWSGTAPNFRFAGLKWYQLMVGLDRFWVDVRNNLRWLLLGVIPTVVIALFIAYLLEISPIRGIEGYVRTLILYPVAMSFIVTGTIWSWMYQPDKGVLNTIFRALRLDFLTSNFVNDPKTATLWLIVIFIWQYLGFAVIILQSSFRTTELQEMIEAATVDGASKLRILFDVIVPNIRSGLLILVSLLLISTLKVFDIVYIVTFGGPGYSTDVLAFFMFIATFQQHLVALGAGLGVIIFLIAFIVVIPYTLYAFQRWFE
ncbi:sugar ABC transporter permease [uncultured Thermanaerothrix sp.]|uniref:carbohydrate ABC transporter permease n=1 Tax=uncultured Thermanaerothrix sp. TaxID=1195149 RepID=UPI0026380FE5|nr:sugar ABC transporter permease [uncultured Thermanaerothrix sp.]